MEKQEALFELDLMLANITSKFTVEERSAVKMARDALDGSYETEWNKTEDLLPAEGELVWVCNADGKVLEGSWKGNLKGWFRDGIPIRVTHWTEMRKPKPLVE